MPHDVQIIFENNAIDRTGDIASAFGAMRILLVTDSGIVEAGHAPRVCKSLKHAGLSVVMFTEVHENPTTRDVDACVAVAKDSDIDLIIGLGGGSSLDTAKGCNFILTNGGRIQDYWGVNKATKPMLPFIAIPTTAGTGSECQSFALIADETTHQKMACGDKKALARIAILDPMLTLSQPAHVTAAAGIDAVAHAVESAVCTTRNSKSIELSHRAFALTQANLSAILQNPEDINARGAMLHGASLAGMAIERSMLGAAHSCANPLTAHFNMTHGSAVGMMLPHVVRFNAVDPTVRDNYNMLAVAGGLTDVDELIVRLEYLLTLTNQPRTLADVDIPSSSIALLADDASKQWTAQFNPRDIDTESFTAIYEAAR